MRTFTKHISVLMVFLSILVFVSQSRAQVTLYTQNWETAAVGQVPPSGWAVDLVAGTNYTWFQSAGTWPTCTPFTGNRFVEFQSFNASSGTINRLRQSTPISTAGYTSITVNFEWLVDPGNAAYNDGMTVQWSINGNSWTNATDYLRHGATQQWIAETCTLPVGAQNQATLYVAFYFHSSYGNNCHLDDMTIKGIQTGNLTGTVRNCVTYTVLPNVQVMCGGGMVLTNAAGIYNLINIHSGLQNLSASLPAYLPYSANVNVVPNVTTTYDFCMSSNPGIITGVVTNCANGNPVVGAYITWGTFYTYSVVGGAYSLTIYATGTNALGVSKEGFNTFTQSVSVTPSPPNIVVNCCLNEDTPPPSQPFVAALNSGQTAVTLNWGLPVDDMQLIYDDGIQDNFAIWSVGTDNLNAVKFTPISYPTIVKGFYYNIGTAASYPVGSNPFTAIQLSLWTEAPGGIPGALIPGTSTVLTPSTYEWGKCSFTNTATITSGDFFIVVSQLNPAATSPGIAVDTTISQMRSYSRFGVNGVWVPGPGNFMIRAIVNGSGGPLLMEDKPAKPITAFPAPGLNYQYQPGIVSGYEGSPKVYPEMGNNPDNLLGYQAWRLTQGQETSPALWTSIGTTTNTTITDNLWQSFPCGPYRWAAKAQYTFNRWSTAAFSNSIGKCWTCNVTVNMTLSCDSMIAHPLVVFHNLDTDTIYSYTMTAPGTHTFTNFWLGHYSLTVSCFDFPTYTETPIAIFGDVTFNVFLTQLKPPPTGVHVADTADFVNWFPPQEQQAFFTENFTGGFAVNNWVPDAGSNWAINAANGNPGACAQWNWTPEQFNYSQSLTSKTFNPNGSDVLYLKYDLNLYNYGTTTLEQLAVEVYDGSAWYSVANYDNSSGSSLPYTTETTNITPYAPNSGFKVRFRAHGVDSYWITSWDIDNVKLVAATALHDPCLIGYNVSLNGSIDGFTADTFYQIPPSHVQYGHTYQVCVNALYGSGTSSNDCVNFTAFYLCPPDSLSGAPIGNSAFLSWQQPYCGDCINKQYKYDNDTANNGYTYGVAGTVMLGNYFPLSAFAVGKIKSFDIYFSSNSTTSAQTCIVYIYNASHSAIIGQSLPFVNSGAAWPAGTWVTAPVADVPYTGHFFGMVDYSIITTPYKNFEDADNNTVHPGYAQGLGYVDIAGTWSLAAGVFGDPKVTFLERVNVCETSSKDAPVKTINPAQMPPVSEHPVKGPAISTGLIANNPAGKPAINTSPENPESDPVLIGYRVFRNNVLIQTILDPSVDSTYDYNLPPGIYHYYTEAIYNVSPYNPPTYTDYSSKMAPVTISVNTGFPLPFFESWTNGSFGYQQWTFSPNQGNWIINTAFGDPTPCADFHWNPVITNYSLSLLSPYIDASAYSCADVFCDFDLKLDDHYATGTEKLDLDIMSNGVRINKAEFADSGSFDWSHKHINISDVKGGAFQIIFRANGVSTANINHWYIDNIEAYAVCRPPKLLAGHQNQFTTTLTWHSPVCSGPCMLRTYILDSGIAGNAYSNTTLGIDYELGNYIPIAANATGTIRSVDLYFTSNSNSSSQICFIYFFLPDQTTIIGQSIPFQNIGAPWPAGTWVNVNIADIPYHGPFYAMVEYHINALPKKNPLCCDITSTFPGYPQGYGFVDNNGTFSLAAATFSDPAATFMIRVNVCENGNKDKKTPITTIDPASHLYYAPQAPAGSQMMGYNVWRENLDSLTAGFKLMNHTIVSDTTFLDPHPTNTLPTQHWKYYVTAEYQDSLNPAPPMLCEPSSDTISIDFPVIGFNNLTGNQVSLYPNPATEIVNVVSTDEILSIDVLNYLGETVYKAARINQKATHLKVSSFKAGVYFVKVPTESGIFTTKITVTH
jgi:hypothetical protein